MLDVMIFIFGLVYGIVTILGWLFGGGDIFSDKN